MDSFITRDSGKDQSILYTFVLILTLACILILSAQIDCFATTVGLQWNAVTNSGLAGYKVHYQADSSVQPFTSTGATQGNSPVDVHNQTSATIGGLDPSHAYYIAVTAYDTAGVESTYSNIAYVPELVSPTVAITSPTNNATVSGTVSITASGSDNVGVTKVEFYVNGVLKTTDTSTPYVYSWNTSSLASGAYTLMAKAYDAAGNIGQSGNVSVTVVNDTTAPVVSVASPANNATVSGTVAITASASDNVGVSMVEFYENGILLSSTNVVPYSYNWNTSTSNNGSYTLTAKAYDSVGNVAQSSSVIITLANTIYNQGTGTYYSSLQQAYDNASTDATLLVLGTQLNENIICAQAKNIKIMGGYNLGFTSNSGFTTLHGTYRLGQGTVVMNKLVIK